MRNDITKQDLYESVKTLVETQEPHLQFNQHKLFTLFSIAFQYMLYCSTKNPGAYIIRIEDSQLADKLARKAKDSSTRKFIQSLLIPRKLKFKKSMFFLDFFHVGSWNLTNEINPEKIKGAIIIKGTDKKPMSDIGLSETEDGLEEAIEAVELPEGYYLDSLTSIADKTITISFEKDFEQLHEVRFPFIKKDVEKTVSGVTLGKDVDWDSISD